MTTKAPGNRSIASLISVFKTQFRSDSGATVKKKAVGHLGTLIRTRCSDGTLTLEKALGFFDSTIQMRPIPSVFLFNHLLGTISEMKHYSIVVSLYKELMFLGCRNFRPNHHTLNIVIASICRLKKADFGFSVLGAMFKHGVKVNAYTLNSLLHGLCTEGLLVEACELFLEMLEKNHPCDELSYSILINGFCKAGEIHKGIGLLKHMYEDGTFKPSAGCYCPIIDSVWKDGRMDEALSIFKHMTDRDVQPNVVVFNSLINGLCKSSRWDEAMEFLEIMTRWEIAPNIYTFNTLLYALCKEERYEQILDVIEARSDKGQKHDVLVYSSLVSGFCRSGCWRKAVDLLDKVKKVASPDVVTFTIVIDAFVKLGLMEDAMSVFHAMLQRNVSPCIATYGTLLCGLSHADQWVEASRLLNEMVSLRIFPNRIALNGILDAYVEKGMMPKAQKMFQGMLQLGPRPDTITFNIMIKGYCRQGEMDKAMKVFKQMGSRPSIISYNTLAIGYMKVNKIYFALKLLDDAIRGGVAPNNVTQNIWKSIHAREIVLHSRIRGNAMSRAADNVSGMIL